MLISDRAEMRQREMRMIMVLSLTMALLIGCASHVVYLHPNYTPELLAKDSYECERDAQQSGYFRDSMVGAINAQNFIDQCLAARGWVKTAEEGSLVGSPQGETMKQGHAEQMNYDEEVRNIQDRIQEEKDPSVKQIWIDYLEKLKSTQK